MEPREALNTLQQLYAGYLDTCAQADTPGWLERLLQGGPSRAERKAVTDFYHAVEQAVLNLRADLTAADTELAAQTVRFMILDARGSDSATQLTLDAVQPLAMPLLDVLTPEDGAAILAAYKARYPKKRMLTPTQQSLLKALEQFA